jgi:molybdate transport system regulatory protein
MTSQKAPQVRLRLDLAPGTSVGPGKIALLEHIDACGSLSQAARKLGLSYRRAWLLLDDLNRAFNEPVTVSTTGGRRGGGASLTKLGRELIRRYRKVEATAASEAGKGFRAFGTRSAATNGARLRRPVSRPIADRARPTEEA